MSEVLAIPREACPALGATMLAPAGHATAIDKDVPPPLERVHCLAHRDAGPEPRGRCVAEEVPVAFCYDGSSHAVMMATPADLADFAIGFSLADGVIARPAEIESLEIVSHDNGIELRMWLASARGTALAARRRRLAGPTGCGLCGVESLEGAVPKMPRVAGGIAISRSTVALALRQLTAAQLLYERTRAVHAAGFFVPGRGLVSVREDVGRHNALDKLIGDLARRGITGACGLVVLTSRISVEMVHKTATLGAGVIVAVSAPTALAIRAAGESGITLVGVARDDGFEVFTGAHRVLSGSPAACSA